MPMNKTFSPPWWAVVLVLVLGGAMSAAGVWQVQRGQEKEALIARYAAAAQQEARYITAGAWAEPGAVERARIYGRYDASMQLLLDNQSRKRVPGYRVWTPVRLRDGGVGIVDRGWIPAPGDRSQPPQIAPPPDGDIVVEGYWRTLPEPGMRLDVDNCADGPWPRIVHFPTIEELRCLYGEFVAGGLLLMDANAPGGFVREWNAGPEMSATKHYGYAAQWFVFTLLLVGLFVKFSFRPKR